MKKIKIDLDNELAFINGEEVEVRDNHVDALELKIHQDHLEELKVSDLHSKAVLYLETLHGLPMASLVSFVRFKYKDKPFLEIEISTDVFSWDGLFGLRTYLEAIIDQMNYSTYFTVMNSSTKGNNKFVTTLFEISSNETLSNALWNISTRFEDLVNKAEVTLIKRAMAKHSLLMK